MTSRTVPPKPDTSYGSDQHGLIWGYRFAPDQPARAITSEEVFDWLSMPESGKQDEFFWLHYSLSNSATEPWLKQSLNLPDAFYQALHSDVASTRLEQDEDSLVAVIHDVIFEFSFDASDVATTGLCINRKLMITARLHPLRSIDHLRTSVRAGQLFRSPVELLAHLLRDQAGVLVDVLRQTTVRVDQIEDQLLANHLSANRSQLGSIRRMLVRLQRLLAPEPAALFRLLNKPPAWISKDDLQDLQQSAEEFSAAVGDSAALVERVKLLQEELAALVNEQTNRTLFVLTVVTVIALPVNLVAGLFGMNVGGIPLAEHGYGFFLVVIPLISLTGLLAYLALGRRKDQR